MREAAVREAVADAALPAAQPLPLFARGAGVGASSGAGAGVGAGSGTGTAAAKLQGLLHGRNSPTASSSNGRPQSPLAVAAAAAAAFAGASNRRPRRRSSKSDVGNSFVTSTPAVCYDV